LTAHRLALAALILALAGAACGGDDTTDDSSPTAETDTDTDTDTDPDTDTEVDPDTCVPGDAKAVADLSCQAFCQPIVAAGCSNVPDMPSCLEICQTYAEACPEWIVALDDCMVAEEPEWICDEEDEVDLVGTCRKELDCMVICLDGDDGPETGGGG